MSISETLGDDSLLDVKENKRKISELTSAVEGLRLDFSELELATRSEDSGDGFGEEDGIEPVDTYAVPDNLVDFPPEKPFEIRWVIDNDDPHWEIFLPEGCVVVGTEAASFEEGGLVSDYSQEHATLRAAETVYCKVTKSGSSYKYTITDSDSTGANDKFVFSIARFDMDNEEIAATLVNDVVVLGNADEAPVVGDGILSLRQTTASGEVELLGSFSANQTSNATINLTKVNDGNLQVKFGSDSATNVFTANQSGDSTITFAKVADTGSYDDLSDQPDIPAPIVPPGGASTVTFVADIQYDVSTRQLQKKIGTLTVATGAIVLGDWVMITGGQCVPHADA